MNVCKSVSVIRTKEIPQIPPGPAAKCTDPQPAVHRALGHLVPHPSRSLRGSAGGLGGCPPCAA